MQNKPREKTSSGTLLQEAQFNYLDFSNRTFGWNPILDHHPAAKRADEEATSKGTNRATGTVAMRRGCRRRQIWLSWKATNAVSFDSNSDEPRQASHPQHCRTVAFAPVKLGKKDVVDAKPLRNNPRLACERTLRMPQKSMWKNSPEFLPYVPWTLKCSHVHPLSCFKLILY